MTHIVYDGKALYADRKCYRETGEVLERHKIKSNTSNGVKRVWAFAGGFQECLWGDKVIASGFDKNVIADARATLTNTSGEIFGGIYVEKAGGIENVYFVNYFGDRLDVILGDEPLVVGAMNDVILGVWRALATVCSFDHTKMRNTVLAVDDFDDEVIPWCIYTATLFTQYDQTGFSIDKVDI